MKQDGASFTTLLRMACHGKLMNCLLGGFPIDSFQAVVAMEGATADVEGPLSALTNPLSLNDGERP